MTSAQAHWLPDGRLHLHHGPIDLIVQIDGPRGAYAAAARRFDTILDELAGDLPRLRRPVGPGTATGVAGRMIAAVRPWSGRFVTPMAAVAGAVADEVLAAITGSGPVTKAVINNGGDVAFHLSRGAAITALGAVGTLRIEARDTVRGLATSGWCGRSHSLGIADAVTVTARTAAAADAAATLIANAVDLPGHPAIRRQPAHDLAPDSDLGPRLVTTDVGPLTGPEIAQALDRGAACARWALDQGLIEAAALKLADQTRTLAAKAAQQEALDA